MENLLFITRIIRIAAVTAERMTTTFSKSWVLYWPRMGLLFGVSTGNGTRDVCVGVGHPPHGVKVGGKVW